MNLKFWFFGKTIGTNTTQHKPAAMPPEPIEPIKYLSNMDVEEIRSVVREELSQSQLDCDKLATSIVTALNNVNKHEVEQHKNIIARLREIASMFAWISPLVNTLLAGFGIWILRQSFETWITQGNIDAAVLSCANMFIIIFITALQWVLFHRIRKELKQSTSISVLVGVIATDTALVMTATSILSLILQK